MSQTAATTVAVALRSHYAVLVGRVVPDCM